MHSKSQFWFAMSVGSAFIVMGAVISGVASVGVPLVGLGITMIGLECMVRLATKQSGHASVLTSVKLSVVDNSPHR